MRFIKKLVILTGGYSKGTLMLEKNSFGVWGKLSLFDYTVDEGDRLVVISGGSMFVMRLSAAMLNKTFEIGEMELDAVHAAVVGEDVMLYGSNCARKLSPSVVLEKVKSEERRLKDNERKFIKFSGRECNYFKEIAPPPYNDFAIADKNYFPAYLNVGSEQDEPEPLLIEEEKVEEENRPMPHVLEQRYLHLMEVAASILDKSERNDETTVNIVDLAPSREGVGGEAKAANAERVDIDAKAAFKQEKESAVKLSDEKVSADPDAQKVILSDAKVAPTASEHADAKIAPTMSEQAEPSVRFSAKSAKTIRDFKEEQPIKGRKATYFERSSEALDRLLKNNERYAPIERLIPGSKFVKINYDGQRYYLVGVIGTDYICYGVPAAFSETPPVPLSGYARWLPSDASNPRGEGFWMMYQDGVSGETLKN